MLQKMPNKTFLIYKHEFFSTIKRTGFIILTLILPVLALLAIGVVQLITGMVKPSTTVNITSIGYVDEANGFNRFNTQGNIELVPFGTKDAALQAMVKGDIKEYFVIPPDYNATGTVQRYILEKQLSAPPDIQSAIKNFLSDNLLGGKFSNATIGVIESPLNLVTTRLTPTGELATDQGGMINLIVPGIFGLLLSLSLSFTSAYVLQGLSEEKENRLMEILLSSISARQLVIGKVLGIGTAGLAQIVVWVISIPLLLSLASSSIGGFISTIQIPANLLALGIIYFVLGYLLYGTLSAGVSAVTSTAKEAQGFAAMYSLFAVAPFWFFSLIILFPDNPVWVVFSIFPFSAPVMVLVRMGISGVPGWQIAASLGVLVLSIIIGLLIVAKLLRVYLLMYGKRPGLPEIIRSIRRS